MTQRYERTRAVVTREIAGETMLVPVRGNLADMQKVFALDETARFIWDLLETPSSIVEMAETVTREFKVAGDEAGRDVKEFVEELRTAGLVEPT
jgi:hypothetical protein